MQTTTAGSGPGLLRAEPHPPPRARLVILGLRNHRIGLWVVLPLNQSPCQEMAPRGFCLRPCDMVRGWQQQRAELLPTTPGRQLAQSSARMPTALIQHQATPGMNFAQTGAGFAMPHSSKVLFSSQQLPTLQKEYQPGMKPA